MDPDFAPPPTRYTESEGLSIAYQVFGKGTQDLVVVPGIVAHLVESWQDPGYRAVMRRLGQSFRVILFDKLGQGLSDRFEGVPKLEPRMDDLRAVMLAVGSAGAGEHRCRCGASRPAALGIRPTARGLRAFSA